ncbi:hypothetical protein [Micromonospora coerulea]|uniref:hypothetical protein n=1 Tax=Micromonospora coerulea TaxID=47856 RepID=UPI001909049F|nr:hypothetical protein [Micromonospora veneta]
MEGDGARRILEGLVRVQAGDVVPAGLLLLTANVAALPGLVLRLIRRPAGTNGPSVGSSASARAARARAR